MAQNPKHLGEYVLASPPPTMQGRVIALLKFGKRQHMEALVHRGIVHMRPLSYFIRSETDPERADIHEGADFCWPPGHIRIMLKLGNMFREVPGIAGTTTSRAPEGDKVNVYCMYGLRELADLPLIANQMISLGETFVIFKNAENFLRRLHSVAAAQQYNLRFAPVRYVDQNTYYGTMDAFTKFSRLAHQCEMRAIIDSGTGCELNFELGDLSDIAFIGETAKLNEILEIVPINNAKGES